MNRARSTCLSLFAILLLPLAANADLLITDFETGYPEGYFQYNGGGFISGYPFFIPEGSPVSVQEGDGDNTVFIAEYDLTGTFGGWGQDFTPSPQDWSSFGGVSFWMFGNNTGAQLQFEILDNSPDSTSANSERFDTTFFDDFNGWAQIEFSFSDFTRATDFNPPTAPDDGLTLTEVWGYAFVLDNSNGFSVLAFDDITLVPEPATLALLALGFAGMAARRRKIA